MLRSVTIIIHSVRLKAAIKSLTQSEFLTNIRRRVFSVVLQARAAPIFGVNVGLLRLLLRLPFWVVADGVGVQLSLDALLQLPHWFFAHVLGGAKLDNFTLQELDGLCVALGEFLLQAADKHVLEVVFVTCARLALNRTKLVDNSGRWAPALHWGLRWWLASNGSWVGSCLAYIELTFDWVTLSCRSCFHHVDLL